MQLRRRHTREVAGTQLGLPRYAFALAQERHAAAAGLRRVAIGQHLNQLVLYRGVGVHQAFLQLQCHDHGLVALQAFPAQRPLGRCQDEVAEEALARRQARSDQPRGPVQQTAGTQRACQVQVDTSVVCPVVVLHTAVRQIQAHKSVSFEAPHRKTPTATSRTGFNVG